MRKVRIVNEGKPAWATEITDAETGQKIECIYRVSVTFDANDKHPPLAVLWAHLPVVDMTVDAEIHHTCPLCGTVKEDTK